LFSCFEIVDLVYRALAMALPHLKYFGRAIAAFHMSKMIDRVPEIDQAEEAGNVLGMIDRVPEIDRVLEI